MKSGNRWLRTGTVSRLRFGRCGLWIPVRKRDFTPRRSDRRRVAPGSRGVKFTIHLHPVPRCRYNSAPSMCLPGLDKNNFVFTFEFVALERSLQLFPRTVGLLDWRSDGVLCCACIDSSSPLGIYVYFRHVFKIEFSAVLQVNVFRNVKLDSFWMNS